MSDLTVIKGNIEWCQNELRTQGNSLLLTIGKGNNWKLSNIMDNCHFFRKFQWKVTDNLGSHMVGRQTLRLENFNLTLPNAL